MHFKVKGILSYPHLNQARSVNPGDAPKFGCSVLILKTDPQVAQIQSIIEQEKANGWPSGFPTNGKTFMKDCAVAFPDQPDVHGYMVISGNANADSKPQVVDANLQPVIDPSLACAGSVCWIAFNSFVYNQPVNKGVGAGLNGVMITGEMGVLGRLDGKPSLETMFAGVNDGATTTAAPQQVAPSPASPPPAPNAEPQYIMTAKAAGNTRQQLLDNGQGWTDELLLSQDMMTLPGGVTTSFQ